MSLLNAAV